MAAPTATTTIAASPAPPSTTQSGRPAPLAAALPGDVRGAAPAAAPGTGAAKSGAMGGGAGRTATALPAGRPRPAAATDGPAAAPAPCAAAASIAIESAGTTMTPPHLEHLNRRPAALSGARRRAPQVEQATVDMTYPANPSPVERDLNDRRADVRRQANHPSGRPRGIPPLHFPLAQNGRHLKRAWRVRANTGRACTPHLQGNHSCAAASLSRYAGRG